MKIAGKSVLLGSLLLKVWEVRCESIFGPLNVNLLNVIIKSIGTMLSNKDIL